MEMNLLIAYVGIAIMVGLRILGLPFVAWQGASLALLLR